MVEDSTNGAAAHERQHCRQGDFLGLSCSRRRPEPDRKAGQLGLAGFYAPAPR